MTWFSPKRQARLWVYLGCLGLLYLLCGCRSQGVGIEAQAQNDAKLRIALGKFSPVAGTPHLMAPAVVADYDQSVLESLESIREKKVGQFRNFFFFNSADSANQWLVPHSNFLFVDALELPLRPAMSGGTPNSKKEQEPPKPAQLLYYELVKADTNSNKVFEDSDRKTIAISEVSGSGYQELIKDIDRTLHRMMNTEDELLIIYRSNNKHFAARLSLSKRQITETKELAPIPQIQPLS
jgi:hypothetical protein